MLGWSGKARTTMGGLRGVFSGEHGVGALELFELSDEAISVRQVAATEDIEMSGADDEPHGRCSRTGWLRRCRPFARRRSTRTGGRG